MAQAERTTWVDWMDHLDRRVIYGVMILVLLGSTFMKQALPPAKLPTAEKAFSVIEQLEPDAAKIVFVALDWDGSTKAENQPQTEALLEHLMRRRIHFALISSVPNAEPFLLNLPLEVAKKNWARTPRTKNGNTARTGSTSGFAPPSPCSCSKFPRPMICGMCS